MFLIIAVRKRWKTHNQENSEHRNVLRILKVWLCKWGKTKRKSLCLRHSFLQSDRNGCCVYIEEWWSSTVQNEQQQKVGVRLKSGAQNTDGQNTDQKYGWTKSGRYQNMDFGIVRIMSIRILTFQILSIRINTWSKKNCKPKWNKSKKPA